MHISSVSRREVTFLRSPWLHWMCCIHVPTFGLVNPSRWAPRRRRLGETASSWRVDIHWTYLILAFSCTEGNVSSFLTVPQKWNASYPIPQYQISPVWMDPKTNRSARFLRVYFILRGRVIACSLDIIYIYIYIYYVYNMYIYIHTLCCIICSTHIF